MEWVGGEGKGVYSVQETFSIYRKTLFYCSLMVSRADEGSTLFN